MKNKLLFLTLLCLTGCNNVEPNHEGVLMQNYGRNGEKDFTIVTGSQGPLGIGSALYHVPMWEQKADPEEIGITAKDGGYFTVDARKQASSWQHVDSSGRSFRRPGSQVNRFRRPQSRAPMDRPSGESQ
jgi:hypothetical protein